MSINMAGASVAHTCARDPIRRTMWPMYPPQPLVLAIADLPVQIDGERAVEVPLLDQHGAAIRQEFSD